jgi:hypothetical protein
MSATPAHPRVHRGYRIPRFKELPIRIQAKVHNCPQYAYKKEDQIQEGPPICANCKKIVPWFCFKCVKCDRYFIKDFRHPKFCPLYPTCWEHTLELEWDHCPDHQPSPAKFEFYEHIVEPKGLNPKKIVIDLENDPRFAFLKK